MAVRGFCYQFDPLTPAELLQILFRVPVGQEDEVDRLARLVEASRSCAQNHNLTAEWRDELENACPSGQRPRGRPYLALRVLHDLFRFRTQLHGLVLDRFAGEKTRLLILLFRILTVLLVVATVVTLCLLLLLGIFALATVAVAVTVVPLLLTVLFLVASVVFLPLPVLPVVVVLRALGLQLVVAGDLS